MTSWLYKLLHEELARLGPDAVADLIDIDSLIEKLDFHNQISPEEVRRVLESLTPEELIEIIDLDTLADYVDAGEYLTPEQLYNILVQLPIESIAELIDAEQISEIIRSQWLINPHKVKWIVYKWLRRLTPAELMDLIDYEELKRVLDIEELESIYDKLHLVANFLDLQRVANLLNPVVLMEFLDYNQLIAAAGGLEGLIDLVALSNILKNDTSWYDPQQLKDDIKDDVIRQSSYSHEQSNPSTEWEIVHNLDFRPAVTTVTYGGNQINGYVQYESDTMIRVSFSVPVAGFAYLS